MPAECMASFLQGKRLAKPRWVLMAFSGPMPWAIIPAFLPHYCWCAVGALCFDVTSTGCRSYSSARCWPRNAGNAVRSGWLQLWAVLGSGLARYLGACWRVLEAFCRYSLKAQTGHIVHIFGVSLRILRTRVCFQLRRRQSFWIYSSCLTTRRLCGHEHGRYARLLT